MCECEFGPVTFQYNRWLKMAHPYEVLNPRPFMGFNDTGFLLIKI